MAHVGKWDEVRSGTDDAGGEWEEGRGGVGVGISVSMVRAFGTLCAESEV